MFILYIRCLICLAYFCNVVFLYIPTSLMHFILIASAQNYGEDYVHINTENLLQFTLIIKMLSIVWCVCKLIDDFK